MKFIPEPSLQNAQNEDFSLLLLCLLNCSQMSQGGFRSSLLLSQLSLPVEAPSSALWSLCSSRRGLWVDSCELSCLQAFPHAVPSACSAFLHPLGGSSFKALEGSSQTLLPEHTHTHTHTHTSTNNLGRGDAVRPRQPQASPAAPVSAGPEAREPTNGVYPWQRAGWDRGRGGSGWANRGCRPPAASHIDGQEKLDMPRHPIRPPGTQGTFFS